MKKTYSKVIVNTESLDNQIKKIRNIQSDKVDVESLIKSLKEKSETLNRIVIK